MFSQMNPQKLDRVGFFLFILLSLFMGYQAWLIGFGSFSHPGPGLIPFLAASALLLVSVIQIISPNKEGLGPVPDPTIPESWKKMVAITLSLLAYGVLIERLGFVTTTFFWLVFLFELSRPSRLTMSLLGAALATAICFVLFVILCRLQLPLGPFGF
jgi:putative tricarboxylic transport membrane protein